MSDPKQPQSGTTADCAAFQQRLPQMFGTETDFTHEPHLQSCENCAELVRDLEYIAQQAKLLMPIHDPSPSVWSNIQSILNPAEDAADTAEPNQK